MTSTLAATETIRQHLEPGLYKLGVEADARDFDWESLYIVLNDFGNVNQRTGPWDFDFDGARPLVPAYWVFLNERKIGLWSFNRPSVLQLTEQRFKGEACFWIESEGDYEIRCEPYKEFNIEWTDARLEVSEEDTLLDALPFGEQANFGLQKLFDSSRFDTLRRRLDDPAFPYKELLCEAFERALQEEGHMALPVLAANYRLLGDEAALSRARAIIIETLALPAWGKPQQDGYGYNADYGAAQTIFDMTFALTFLHEELGEALVEEMLQRLEKQCETFLELALLQHGFWGGSILQGHGYLSFCLFSSTAYALLGRLPAAEKWLRFCLPRMERTWQAMPTDGVIPSTSYHRLDLLVSRIVLFREMHLQATGEDIYHRPVWRNVIDFCVESYSEQSKHFVHAAARGDESTHINSIAFLDQMARAFADADAAWLAREGLFVAESKDGGNGFKSCHDILWAALLYEPLEVPAPALRAPRRLRWFKDSSAIVFRDDEEEILFSTRLGNSNSRTSWSNASNHCDRISFAPIAGNFAIAHRGLPLIQTAEGGYSMRSEIGNIVLVDGKGQSGDFAYAMGYPDAPLGDEWIEDASFVSATGVGHIRMQLASAYDAAHGLEYYTREWFFESDGRMRLVDTIQAREPHRFTWLFHTYRAHPIIAHEDDRFTIRNGEALLNLRLENSTTPLKHSIADTLTVWSYSNQQGGNSCYHLALETRNTTSHARVEFEFSFENAPKI